MERLEVLGGGEYGYKDQALILKLSCGREAPLEASPTLGEQSKVYLGVTSMLWWATLCWPRRLEVGHILLTSIIG